MYTVHFCFGKIRKW